MKKEDLIALGLTEEQADKVIVGYGQMVPKSRLDDKIAELNEAKNEIATRDTQLEDLKKVDAAGLQTKITELQTANETSKTEYEQKIADIRKESAIKLALAGKVHDAGIALRELDTAKIELDEEGNIKTGFDEQLTTLKESKSFLFVPEKKETPPSFKGWNPADGDKGAEGQVSAGASFAKQANEQHKSTEKTPWD